MIITRGHHAVAGIGPARRQTGADLRTALDGLAPPDDRFAEDIEDAVAALTNEGFDGLPGVLAGEPPPR